MFKSIYRYIRLMLNPSDVCINTTMYATSNISDPITSEQALSQFITNDY